MFEGLNFVDFFKKMNPQTLTSVADELDNLGLHKQASDIDTILRQAAYNAPKAGKKKKRWSVKYKKNINCDNPKGFSQKQYCKRKKRGGGYKS